MAARGGQERVGRCAVPELASGDQDPGDEHDDRARAGDRQNPSDAVRRSELVAAVHGQDHTHDRGERERDGGRHDGLEHAGRSQLEPLGDDEIDHDPVTPVTARNIASSVSAAFNSLSSDTVTSTCEAVSPTSLSLRPVITIDPSASRRWSTLRRATR